MSEPDETPRLETPAGDFSGMAESERRALEAGAAKVIVVTRKNGRYVYSQQLVTLELVEHALKDPDGETPRAIFRQVANLHLRVREEAP